MYSTIWLALFVAGLLLGVGAFVGYARGAASILGFLTWALIGNGVAGLYTLDQAGSEVFVGSDATAWLCYIIAVGCLITLGVAIHEAYEEAEEENSEIYTE